MSKLAVAGEVEGSPSAHRWFANASSMAARIAWQDSGAGTTPSHGTHAGLEGGELRHGDGLDLLLVEKLRDQLRITVVAQATGVDARRHEVVTERYTSSSAACSRR